MLGPIPVREVMQTPVETVDPDATVREAARRLQSAGIGSLVVCDDESPVGIVTDVDMTGLVADGHDPETTTVSAVMSSPLITVGPEDAIRSAAEAMREHTIKRLPVVEDGAVVGIVTTTDLSNFLPHLVRLGRRERPEEPPERTSHRPDTVYEDEDWEFEYLGSQRAINVGDTVRFTKTLSAEDIEAFAEASGDTNRLHLDGEFAATTRFGERIAHGTLVVGVVSAALARLPGLIIYLSQEVSYLGPVPVDEEVTAECEVVEDIGNDRFRLATAVTTADGETVIDGEAVVISDELPEE